MYDEVAARLRIGPEKPRHAALSESVERYDSARDPVYFAEFHPGDEGNRAVDRGSSKSVDRGVGPLLVNPAASRFKAWLSLES